MQIRLAVSRALFALSGSALLVGAFLHASAYGLAARKLAAGHIPAFFERAFDALWLTDSASTAFVGIFCFVLAVRPQLAVSPFGWLSVTYPLMMSFLLFAKMGSFFAGYVFFVVGIITLSAMVALTVGGREAVSNP